MFNLKKVLIFVLIGAFIIVFSTIHSNAQGPPGHRKGEKKGWTTDTPPGWQKGEKKGWGEGDVPPGLEKGVLEKGKSEEAKEMAVTKGQKEYKGKGKEKGKAWWKFWKREKAEAK